MSRDVGSGALSAALASLVVALFAVALVVGPVHLGVGDLLAACGIGPDTALAPIEAPGSTPLETATWTVLSTALLNLEEFITRE